MTKSLQDAVPKVTTCFQEGMYYANPVKLLGTERTVELSAELCQQRCQVVPGLLPCWVDFDVDLWFGEHFHPKNLEDGCKFDEQIFEKIGCFFLWFTFTPKIWGISLIDPPNFPGRRIFFQFWVGRKRENSPPTKVLISPSGRKLVLFYKLRIG